MTGGEGIFIIGCNTYQTGLCGSYENMQMISKTCGSHKNAEHYVIRFVYRQVKQYFHDIRQVERELGDMSRSGST